MNRAAIINKAAGAFNKVRPALAPEARLFLLKRAGQTKAFTVIFEVTEDYWVRWDGFREQMRFQLASIDEDLPDQIGQTSHIGYGIPDENDKIDVYTIAPDTRDRIPPIGASLFWKLYGQRDATERFTIPAPTP